MTEGSAVTPSDASRVETYRFAFSGSGGEYFRIWIVNLLLCIVTLGIYSPWAKVRANRYLYANTTVAGGHFAYHARPKVILKGRVIAFGMLIVYLLLTELAPILALGQLLLILLLLPWIVTRALNFHAVNSSWNKRRFSFTGKPGQAAGAYFGWPILGALTFGLGVPFAWFKKAQFGVNHHRLGSDHFEMSATARAFYRLAAVLVISVALTLAVFLLLFGDFGILGFAGSVGAEGGLSDNHKAFFGAVTVAAILGLYELYKALRFKAVFDRLTLASNRIDNSLPLVRYLFAVAGCGCLLLLTLGLYYPWARIQLIRLRIESLTLVGDGDVGIPARGPQKSSALGEELGNAFDLGISV